MTYDLKKLRELPDEILAKYSRHSTFDGTGCLGVRCKGCPFYRGDYCGTDGRHMDIVEPEIERRNKILYNSSPIKSAVRLFIETQDLSKVGTETSKKIPLIKLARHFSRNFSKENEPLLGLKESKELIESMYTSDQLYPTPKVVINTDHLTWKLGDYIAVKDKDSEPWENAIYVGYMAGADYPYIVVHSDDTDNFPCYNFRTEKWVMAKK